jgi:hypothetical protein
MFGIAAAHALMFLSAATNVMKVYHELGHLNRACEQRTTSTQADARRGKSSTYPLVNPVMDSHAPRRLRHISCNGMLGREGINNGLCFRQAS